MNDIRVLEKHYTPVKTCTCWRTRIRSACVYIHSFELSRTDNVTLAAGLFFVKEYFTSARLKHTRNALVSRMLWCPECSCVQNE